VVGKRGNSAPESVDIYMNGCMKFIIYFYTSACIFFRKTLLIFNHKVSSKYTARAHYL
jgi:hypothetical protein